MSQQAAHAPPPAGGAAAAAAAPPPWRVSVDYKALRESLPAARANAQRRGSACDPDAVVALHEAFAALKQRADGVREARNAAAASVAALPPAQRPAAAERGRALKAELAALEAQVEAAEAALQREAQRLPNDTHPDVPSGDESNATLLRTLGTMPTFDGFQPADHVALGERLGASFLLACRSIFLVSSSMRPPAHTHGFVY